MENYNLYFYIEKCDVSMNYLFCLIYDIIVDYKYTRVESTLIIIYVFI